jgi:hypothetical protein
MRYESGDRKPDSDFIIAICKEYNVNANWLLLDGDYKYTGQASDSPPPSMSGHAIDEKLLVSVIEAIEEYLADTNRALPPNKKAQLILALYDMFLESEEKKVSKAVVIRLARLAA